MMPGLLQRTAEAIDQMSRSIWDDSSQVEKAVILIFLLITGLAIPVVPLVALARYIAS